MVTFFIFIVIVSAAVTLVSGGAPIRSSSSAVVVSRGDYSRGAPNDLDVTSYLPALTTEYGAADILLDDSK